MNNDKKQTDIINLTDIPKRAILHSVQIHYIDLNQQGGMTIYYPIPAKTAQTKGKIRLIDEFTLPKRNLI